MSTALLGNSSASSRLVEAVAGLNGSAVGTSPALEPLAFLADAVDGALPTESQATAADTSPITDTLAQLPLLGGAEGTAPLQLAGAGTTFQPVFDAANATVLEFHNELVDLLGTLGAEGLAKGIVATGEGLGPGFIGGTPTVYGHTNPVTDILNAPSLLVAGDVDGVVHNISASLTNSLLVAQTSLKDQLLFESVHGNDPLNPVPELISGIGQSLSGNPLLSINGQDGPLGLGAIIGDLSHSNSGHLIDIDIGPQQGGGLVLDLLSAAGSGVGHSLELNVLDVGQSGPTLVELDLLGGDGLLNIPALGGGGLDSLTGNVLGLGDSPAGLPDSGGVLAPVVYLVSNVVDSLPIAGLLNTDHGLLNPTTLL